MIAIASLPCVCGRKVKVNPDTASYGLTGLDYDPPQYHFWQRCQCGQQVVVTADHMFSGEERQAICRRSGLTYRGPLS